MVVGLKFDLTSYSLADLTSVSLNLFAFRLDTSTRQVSLYGVAQGTSSGTGDFGTETWNETANQYGDLPGLPAMDSNPATQNLNTGYLTPLGNYTLASGQLEGTIRSLNNALITSFIQSYSGSQYVTFILAANNQLTDDGPSRASELPPGVAAPPFGETAGSAVGLIVQYAHQRASAITGAVISQSYATWTTRLHPTV
jgi:hypothetical protein